MKKLLVLLIMLFLVSSYFQNTRFLHKEYPKKKTNTLKRTFCKRMKMENDKNERIEKMEKIVDSVNPYSPY